VTLIKNHIIDDGRLSSPQSQETVEAFASLFRGRADVYGHLYDESDPEDPKYITEKEAVTLAHYHKHLLGKRWLGIHPLIGDRCSFAATDLDEHDFQKALAIRNTLQEFDLKAYMAETKHKGYRILIFFDEFQLATDVRLVLKAANEKLGLSCEIFPKQNSLPLGSLKEGEIGNFVNLPYFKDRCPFLTGNNKPVLLQYALDHIKYNTEEHLRRALEEIEKAAKTPSAGKQPKHTPCIAKILWGVDKEQRDTAALAIARYYLAWYNPEKVLGLLKMWDGKNKPPLNDEGLLKSKVSVAEYSQATDHGFTCATITNDPRLSMFCVGEQCAWLKELKRGGNLPPTKTSQKLGHAPEEIAQMLQQSLVVGERRPTLVKLAGYLRYRGVPQEVAVALLLPWAEKCFTQPLPPEQVERHIHGVYRRYGLGESKLDKVFNSQALATILPKHKGKRRRN